MRDIWQELEKWHAAGKQIALATVVHLQGSSLRPEGSKMLICQSGEIAGSVTGGCVESAVYDESMAALKAGLPRLVSYGVSNESAWEVGLSCGGSVKILIEPLASESWKQVFPLVKDCIQNNGTAALATAISGPAIGRKLLYFLDGSRAGSLGTPELDQTLISFLAENMSARDPLHLTLPDEQGEVFVEFLLPPPRLVIVGAGHISMPLVRLANELGFHTVVVDARSALATRERFPNVARTPRRLAIRDPAGLETGRFHQRGLPQP